MPNNKRIFISDIHMGDAVSAAPPAPYKPFAWMLEPRITLLANFLQQAVLQDNTVTELVILGDLFDQWTYPPEIAPPLTYDAVAQAPQNQPIMDQLRLIAQQKKLVYVPGNHDQFIHNEAIAFFNQYIPNTVYCGTGIGAGVYSMENGDIIVEHGSRFSLFASPDFWSLPNSKLNLGFYMTRVTSHIDAVNGTQPGFVNMLPGLIVQYMHNLQFCKDLFLQIVHIAYPDRSDILSIPIVMNGLDNIPGSTTVGAVADTYINYLSSWQPLPPLQITPTSAFLNEKINGLSGAATSHYLNNGPAKIVIFGHTHKDVIYGYDRQNGICVDTMSPMTPCDCCYANSGCWSIDENHGGFIEVSKDDNHGWYQIVQKRVQKSGKIKDVSPRYVRYS